MRHSSRWLIGMTAGLVLLLSPAWALASALEIPGDGATVSGIGVISGWKCEAVGDITVSFDGGDPIPLVYGSSRGDTSAACNDDDGLNGFVAIWNWGLLSDGEHTAVVYDNDMEFASSTFTVVNFGQEFVTGAAGECTIDDFPSTGETATFEWNESTQHLELAEIMGAPEDMEDMEDMEPGLAQFDGTWHAEANTTGSGCVIKDFDCEISNGDLSCLGGVVRGTVDSSGSVVGVISFLESQGELSGTIQGGSGKGTVSYPNCSGTWELTSSRMLEEHLRYIRVRLDMHGRDI